MKPRSRTKQTGLNLVERAVIAQEWRHTTLEAQMLALCSLDSDKVVNKAGRTLYVVLGACMAEQLDPEMPEIRILCGSVNAVHDQAGEVEIPELRRASIVRGLQVCAELVPLLERKALVNAACELALKLRTGHVNMSDFEAILRANNES